MRPEDSPNTTAQLTAPSGKQPVARRRREIMLQFVRANRWASTRDLQTLADASAATVRRDLNALARAGLLVRVRGGAALPEFVADLR
jgi:DeoR/GlpR family transcriptional regulator of sugar metabolism